jgi:NADPH2:quinone reductase
MKAAFIETTGTPDQIRVGDLPTPVPGAGEVRVRVTAAALNPIDLYVRAGTVAMQLPMPFVSGCDLAGVVEAVGPQAKRFAVGQRVWGSNQGLLGRQGTSAEFACVREDWLYPTPEGVSDEAAAAAALTGITAHLGLFRGAHLQAGETVFVNGGTGGVGSMVVQMARAVGAKVITTVGSSAKADLARRWGAEGVLNYKTDDIAAGVKTLTGGKGVDVWFETQREPDLARTVDLMAPRGRIVVIAGRAARPVLPVGPFYVKGLTLHGYAMFNATPDEQRPCAEDINRWLAAGKLDVPIGKVFPLAEAAAAHRFLEENTIGGAGTLTGKVLIVP